MGSLVIGSIEQPKAEEVNDGKMEEFYVSKGLDVELVHGAVGARERLRRVLHQPSAGRCLALRDYYPAWAEAGRKAEAGKPLFLESKDTKVLQIFFDDHILPHDACIVDVRHADELSSPQARSPPPVGSVFGMHLVRAEPLRSIMETDYFLDAISAAEHKWKAAWKRRRLFRTVLLEKTEDQMKEAHHMAKSPSYVPYAMCDLVTMRSDTNSNDVADELDVESLK